MNRVIRTGWSLAVRAVKYELGMWRALFRWIARRGRADAGTETFGYARMVTPILVVFIVLSAIEIPILDLVLPWETARLIAAAAGVYGVVWMIGLLASMRVNRHVVDDHGLRLRSGPVFDVTVPWSDVAAIRSHDRLGQGNRGLRVHDTDDGPVLSIVVGGQTHVELDFVRPVVVAVAQTKSKPVVGLRFCADEPADLVAAVRKRLAAPDETAAAGVAPGPR